MSRALWDYVHDADVARHYDASLSDSSLFSLDLQFAEHWLRPPGRLIDLGCGTGRLAVRMGQLGHTVLGVDLSAEMLKTAQAKAKTLGFNADFMLANLVELDCLQDEYFDHAACLFSTLGMIDGADARRRVVRHVFRLLKPGGRFVVHVHNWWFSLRDTGGRRWLVQDLVRRLRRDPHAGDRAMPQHHGISNLALHHFTRREISTLLVDEGFRLREVSPVSLHTDGRMSFSLLLPSVRAYGFLIAAEKPTACAPR